MDQVSGLQCTSDPTGRITSGAGRIVLLGGGRREKAEERPEKRSLQKCNFRAETWEPEEPGLSYRNGETWLGRLDIIDTEFQYNIMRGLCVLNFKIALRKTVLWATSANEGLWKAKSSVNASMMDLLAHACMMGNTFPRIWGLSHTPLHFQEPIGRGAKWIHMRPISWEWHQQHALNIT